MKESLDRLRKADPETYQKAFDWLKNVAWSLIKLDPEGYFLFPGPYPLRDALLQAVLQDVITSRGWTIHIAGYPSATARPEGDTVVICNLSGKDEKVISTVTEYSYARSMLAAYLAAIEVQA